MTFKLPKNISATTTKNCQLSYNGCDVNLVVLSFISFSLRFLSAADVSTGMYGAASYLASFSEQPVNNSSDNWNSFCLYIMAKCVQTSTKRGENAVLVAWLESAIWQGWQPWCPGAQHLCRYLWHRSGSRCCQRPWAVAGSPRHGRLSLRLQSAALAQTSSPFAVHECHQDSCPGIHLVSPGLL